MKTLSRHPGKFEACPSEFVARTLYEITMNGGHDEEAGDVESTGWYALIQGKRYGFIVEENSQGFFTYEVFPMASLAIAAFEKIAEDVNRLLDTEG